METFKPSQHLSKHKEGFIMRYYPKNAVGFKIDEEVAEVLGPAVSELFETWDGYVIAEVS